MLDLLKKHWLCFLFGGVIGYCIHFCPLLSVSDAKACQCVTCCDPCDCVEACVDDNCPCCVTDPATPAPEGKG